MIKKKLLLISLVTILFIAIFHYFATAYYWYWTYKWIDIPVHIVGGFWVSIVALLVSLEIRHIDSINGYKRKSLLVMIISALIIAFFWEIFELVFKITSLHDVSYWRDSSIDIFNSLVGSVIAFLYFTKNKKSKNHLEDKIIKNDFVIAL